MGNTFLEEKSRYKEYNVYRQYESETEYTPWKWMGSTRAVSEKQAINQVQYRLFEDGTTIYKGRNRTYGCWEPVWKAVVKFSKEDKEIYKSIMEDRKNGQF